MKSSVLAIVLLVSIYLNGEVLKFSTAYELSLQNSNKIKASYYRYKSLESQIKRDRAFMFPHLSVSASIGYVRNRYKYEKPELIENPFTEPIKLPDSLTEVPDDYYDIPEEYTQKPEGFENLTPEQQKTYLEKQQKALEEYKIKQKKALDKFLKKQKKDREKYIRDQEEYREKELKKIEKKNNKILKKAHDATLKKGIVNKIQITLTQTIYNREKYKIYESTIIKANKAKIETKIEQQKLSIKVLETYMNILKSYTKLELYKSFIKYHKSLLRFNEKSYKLGLISKIDIMKERVAHKSMKLQLKQEERVLKIYKKQLSNYLGYSEYRLPRIDIWKLKNKTINSMKSFVNDRDNIYSNLEYQISLANIKYLRKMIQVAKSGHYPRINFKASYTKYSGKGTQLVNNVDLSLNLDMPIFEGGYTQARIESAKYELLASLEELKNTRKEMDISYRRYLADFKNNIERLKMDKKAYIVAKAYYSKVNKGYKKGLNSIIELFDAKSQMINRRVDYTESVYKLLDSYINILIMTNRLDKLNIIDRVLGG